MLDMLTAMNTATLTSMDTNTVIITEEWVGAEYVARTRIGRVDTFGTVGAFAIVAACRQRFANRVVGAFVRAGDAGVRRAAARRRFAGFPVRLSAGGRN